MFFRRAPDPTIQLVRFSVIQSVRKHEDRGTVVMDPSTFDWTKPPPPPAPTVPEKITRDNYDRVMRDGPGVIAGIYADIRRDRDESYARFVGPPSPPRSPA
jgi:hypothetical protein